tara:strand:+ start:53 stop:367 length:315 start_codon:yes stop_codon:yes gene_type:complete
MSDKPITARSLRASVIDDNAIISLNIKWLGQICILVGCLVFGYWNVLNRLEKLEYRMAESDQQIEELVEKHIEEEQVRFSKMEEELKWYEKNINPLSWKKRKSK